MRLAEIRKKSGLSQSGLAKQIGYSQNMISQWENGLRDPNTQTLIILANFFNVTIDYLLGRTANTLECQNNIDKTYNKRSEFSVSIGSKIVMLREQKGLTQYELAEKAHISKSVMNRIELGTRSIRDYELISFAKILGVTVDFLLNLTPSDIKDNFVPSIKYSSKENLLIKKYRQLSDNDQEYINDFIDLRLAKKTKI